MKRIITVLAAATLGLGLATAGSTSARGAVDKAPGNKSVHDGYTPPPIKWGPCHDETLDSYGATCGMLVVPLNYARPHGKKIRVAVSRVKHTTARYQGVMLVNPGGPGGSGRIYSVLQSAIPHGAGNSYDWIGFDPRGVGLSSPSLTCNPNFFHGDRPPYRPTTQRIHRAWVSRSKAYAADCKTAQDHRLFRHVKTTDSVADMESLRKALGRTKINFYGFSYGTYLGQVYATLHPDRVRRFVWDSSVNPKRVFYKSNQDQDVAFQKTFDIYFHWLAKYHQTYDVGNTYQQVRRTYLATLAKLDKKAAAGFLGGDEFTDVFTSAGYYVYGWEDIASAYSRYLHTGKADQLIAMYKGANNTSAGGDNGYAMYLGTQCTDAPWPRSQAKLDRDNTRLDRTYDYFTWSNAWFNGPCAYWKFRAAQPVHVKGTKVHVPVLMIDETFDAATPFAGNLVVRKIFKSASLIEGRNGSTHAGTLSGIACTDNAIATYLRNGTVPQRLSGNRSDKVCPPVPQPDPTSAAASRQLQASPKGMPQVLRHALREAQQTH